MKNKLFVYFVKNINQLRFSWFLNHMTPSYVRLFLILSHWFCLHSKMLGRPVPGCSAIFCEHFKIQVKWKRDERNVSGRNQSRRLNWENTCQTYLQLLLSYMPLKNTCPKASSAVHLFFGLNRNMILNKSIASLSAAGYKDSIATLSATLHRARWYCNQVPDDTWFIRTFPCVLPR